MLGEPKFNRRTAALNTTVQGAKHLPMEPEAWAKVAEINSVQCAEHDPGGKEEREDQFRMAGEWLGRGKLGGGGGCVLWECEQKAVGGGLGWGWCWRLLAARESHGRRLDDLRGGVAVIRKMVMKGKQVRADLAMS